jgi:hypothetical protein
MYRWMGGLTDGRMDGYMDECVDSLRGVSEN